MHRLFLRLLTLLSLGLLASACGNPGALYLPDEQAAEGNQESTEYTEPPGPAGYQGVNDEAWLGDPDGPAMDEAEAMDEAQEEDREEERDEAEKDGKEKNDPDKDQEHRPGT